MSNMLVPTLWEGKVQDIPDFRMSWLNELGQNTYCALWLRWQAQDLPQGYDKYVVSFHLEAVDVEWLKRQASLIESTIIVLSDSNYYNYPFPKNVECYTYYWWHYQLEQLQEWFPNVVSKKIQYKFSNICNRITQSKLLVTTILLEHAKEESLIKLSNWEGQDSRLKSPSPQLEELRLLFYSKYFGTLIDLPDSKKFINVHSYSANPWTSIYQNSAIHLTNESFHYSHMGDYTYPGPFITEKTLKCLIGATGFIAVGQYDTYNTLKQLGLKFDYGFDISYDQDPGNLTRLEKTINILIEMCKLDKYEIFELTKSSSEYNQQIIQERIFYKNCEAHNHQVQSIILNKE